MQACIVLHAFVTPAITITKGVRPFESARYSWELVNGAAASVARRHDDQCLVHRKRQPQAVTEPWIPNCRVETRDGVPAEFQSWARKSHADDGRC